MRCVLVGNYGVGNIGDEALKEYFLTEFRDIRWTVVTAKPEHDQDVPRLPLGFRSLFASWWRTISEIRHADALVFGGGSLFTDIESVWACVIWRSYAVVAAYFGVPVILAFQGVGPWKTKLGRTLAWKTYRSAKAISVRDEKSLARVRELQPQATPVLAFDPAFALFAAHQKKPVGRRLVVIPRTNSDDAFFAEVRQKLTQDFTDVRILLMQPDATELRVGERIRKLAGGKAEVVPLTSVRQLLDEVSTASEVVSQRYHGALAAIAMGVPVQVVPQHPGDKMDSLRAAADDTAIRSQWIEYVRIGAEALRTVVSKRAG